MSGAENEVECSVAAWNLPALQEQQQRVRIVLGRTEAPAGQRGPIPLDRGVDAAVDIEVQGRVAARGEVILLDGRLAVRVTELVQERAA